MEGAHFRLGEEGEEGEGWEERPEHGLSTALKRAPRGTARRWSARCPAPTCPRRCADGEGGMLGPSVKKSSEEGGAEEPSGRHWQPSQHQENKEQRWACLEPVNGVSDSRTKAAQGAICM